MTADKLRYAQHLMADRSRSIPAICRELGGIPSSTLYHYLHADGSLKVKAALRSAPSSGNASAKLAVVVVPPEPGMPARMSTVL